MVFVREIRRKLIDECIFLFFCLTIPCGDSFSQSSSSNWAVAAQTAFIGLPEPLQYGIMAFKDENGDYAYKKEEERKMVGIGNGGIGVRVEEEGLSLHIDIEKAKDLIRDVIKIP